MTNLINFSKALAVFVNTIIGAGIFGLPFIAMKAGFWVVAGYFILLGLVLIITNIIYSEVALSVKQLHRFPGYVGEYLGPKWKKITFFSSILGFSGGLLAYLILGGIFLNNYFSPYFGGSETIYMFVFFTIGAYLIFRGIGSISEIELFLLGVLFVILLAFFIKAFPAINLEYFKNIDFKFLALPYGVTLFSLWGGSIVPELKEMLAEKRSVLRKVIISGVIISAITYLAFVFIILGVSGPNTSKEAISGFTKTLGDGVIRLVFIFGMITVFTSFLTLGLTLKKMLSYDFGLPQDIAWFIACFFPLALFFLGLKNFIEVISLTGGVILGFEAMVTVFVYRNFYKIKYLKSPNPLIYLLVSLFLLGIITEISYFFFVKI